MSQGLYNVNARDGRPLSAELWRRARPIMEKVRSATTLEELAGIDGDTVRRLLTDLHVTPPRLGGTRPADQRDGDIRWVTSDDGSRSGYSTIRQYIAVQVEGDIDLLERWPDGSTAELEAVNAHALPNGDWGAATKEQSQRHYDLGEMWTYSTYDDDAESYWALYTFIELTEQEEAAVARGEVDLAGQFQARRAAIEPIADAIGDQVEKFVTVTFPEHVAAMVEGRRTVLSNRQAALDSLVFPNTWKAPEPRVDSSPLETCGPDLDSQNVELAYDPRARLAAASFEDVQHTMRHWANAIERYPAAFSSLEEDRISDLLTATLNATLPGAQREVFTQNGKSDIFIQADILDEGRGPATIFICESKWATSRSVIRSALDPQLFGYLNANDTAAILLILLPQRRSERARNTYLEVLQEVAGYLRTVDSAVQGWPVLEFNRNGRRVSICAAFIKLPR